MVYKNVIIPTSEDLYKETYNFGALKYERMGQFDPFMNPAYFDPNSNQICLT